MSAATTASILPLPVVIPIGSAVIAPLVARLHRLLPLIIAVVAMTTSMVLLVLIGARVYADHGQVLSHFIGRVGPVKGKALGIAFAADPFGLTFALLSALIGLLLLVWTLSELGHLGARELGGLACLFQLLLAALIGVALTADMINLFVWFEVASLASYGLTGFFLERPIALEAAFKVLVLTSIAGFVIFMGAAMLYSQHGALNMGQLVEALRGHIGVPDLVALGLLISGFATKAGLIPFHGWLPDAHTAPPGSVSALFSALMVNLGVVAIARITLQIVGPDSGHAFLGLLMVLGVVSAIVGALLALAQDDLKRLLAWDTVSQMGVLVVGYASAEPLGVAGATYQLINHALYKGLLFLCAGSVVHATGETQLSKMGGLARRRLITTAAFTVGALAIAGVPPMNGYASLGLIHKGLQDSDQWGIFALMLVAQLITIAALGRAAYLGFYRRRERDYEHLERPRPGMVAVFSILCACCVAFGVLPGLVIRRVATPAAASLLHPIDYARGVLSGSAALPTPDVSFHYFEATDLVISLGLFVGGLALAWAYIRMREPRPIRWLRAVHTGSVNDYAAFLAAGMLFVLVGLLA